MDHRIMFDSQVVRRNQEIPSQAIAEMKAARQQRQREQRAQRIAAMQNAIGRVIFSVTSRFRPQQTPVAQTPAQALDQGAC